MELGPRTNDHVAFATYSEWLYGAEERNRFLAFTETATGLEVSTVFLGLDHSHGGGPPVLFETIVFKNISRVDRESVDQERYCTWDAAMEGHKAMVAAHGGRIIPEPVTAQGARDYDEITQAEALLNNHGHGK